MCKENITYMVAMYDSVGAMVKYKSFDSITDANDCFGIWKFQIDEDKKFCVDAGNPELTPYEVHILCVDDEDPLGHDYLK